MNTSIKKDEPKRRGRPATGKDPIIGFRAPPELTAQIDAYAIEAGLKRAAAIRRLVEKGLGSVQPFARDNLSLCIHPKTAKVSVTD